MNTNKQIKGYSDQMLRFISENGNGALIHYVDNIDLTKGIRDLHERKIQAKKLNDVLLIPPQVSSNLRTFKVFISSTIKGFVEI